MLWNNIKNAFRVLSRDKFYALINISGLAIGLAAAIFVVLYVDNELNFDKYHAKRDRIYRLNGEFKIAGKHDYFAITQRPLAPTLKEEFTEIENYCRFMDLGQIAVTQNDNQQFEKNLFFADSTVFQLFTHKFIWGSHNFALTEANTIVLTKSLSEKFFDKENPLGKILKIGNSGNFKVTGVVEDVPRNSHLKFSGLLSFQSIGKIIGDSVLNDRSASSFWNVNVFSYILIKQNSNIQNVINDFGRFYDKHMKSIGDAIQGSFVIKAVKLTDIHFNADADLQGDLPRGNFGYRYVFSIIGLLIVLIACINYINISTARATKRAKEVGIRKVNGAKSKELINQFLGESMLMTLFSLLFAIVLAYIFMPVFSQYSEYEFSISDLLSRKFLFILIFLLIVIGLLSGIYPAWYLSRFNPVEILKGKILFLDTKGVFRKLLVVIQFSISIGLIAGTIVIMNQQKFMENKFLGFNKENIMYLDIRDTSVIKKIEVFKESLEENPDIEQIAISDFVPGKEYNKIIFRVEKDNKLEEVALNLGFVDYDVISLLGLKLKSGRAFDKAMSTDLNKAFMINESASKSLGWGENAIGKRMQFGFDLEGNIRRDGSVIGVINDFHYASVHNKIEPFVFLLNDRPGRMILMKFNTSNIQNLFNFIDSKYNEMQAIIPYSISFLDRTFNEMYISEEKLSKLFSIFSLIAIFVSCLGLLGLSSFLISSRTKEIGIRKVLGAEQKNIIYHLSKEYFLLVLVSNIIAWPVTFFFMDKWLMKFAYHINFKLDNLTWYNTEPFIFAGLAALIIAFLTLSFHTIKAARSNPVSALKYE